VIRRFTVVPLVAAALFGLAACNNSTSGSATAGSSPGGSAPPTTGGASTASLKPCDLVSSAEASGLQLAPQGPVNEGGARACSWQKPVDINGQNGYGVEIGIRDSQSLNDINTAGYTMSQDNIGSHQGRQGAATGSGACLVVIGVGNSSRVDVIVTGGADATSACQFANQLAKFVEPRLPGGGS
jgi:uncharacterized protein DUF3558